MPIKPIPEGYHSVTPFLLVNEASKIIEFLTAAFDAKEIRRQSMPNGAIVNGEIKIGDSMIMICDAPPGHPPTPSMLYLYVPDVDASYKRAILAGGKSLREPADQYYGERLGAVIDRGGNQWWISTRKEELSTEEITRRMNAAFNQK